MEKIDSRENLIRLIEQYQNLVFFFFFKMTGGYCTAEDLTEDTFIAVYKNYERFDGNNEKTWICRIATNKCIDYLKAAARKEVALDDETAESISDSGGLLEEVINKELMEDFLAAIESLDEPYRSVSKKHFIDGKTAKEISVETKIGLKTIQTQIYRARSMLKKIIRKEDLIA